MYLEYPCCGAIAYVMWKSGVEFVLDSDIHDNVYCTCTLRTA